MFGNYGKRALSFLLALTMMLSMAPVQAFATETGEEHEHCEVCGQHECVCPPEEPEHVHDFVAGEVTQPTCGAAGFTVYTCVGCGAVENRDEVAATGDHSYVDAVVDPTTDAQGYTEHTCSVCGHSYQDSFVDALTPAETSEPEHEHDFVAGEPVAPTCVDEGYTPYVCTCGAIENRDEVPALDHTYESEVVEPTAEEQGYTEYTCQVCGDSYKDDFVEYVAEKIERKIPASWTDEMKEVQALIDEYIEYYLGYYEFQMPDETKFADLVRARIEAENEEDLARKLAALPRELVAEWEEIHDQIEGIVLNKMDANERENAYAAVEEVEYMIVEAYALTEEQTEAIIEANPVFVMFSDLVYEHGAALQALADVSNTVGVTGLSVTYTASSSDTLAGTDGKASCTASAGAVTASGNSSQSLLGSNSSTVTITLTNTGYDNALLTFTYTAPSNSSYGTITTTGTTTGSGSSQSFTLAKNQTVTVKLTTPKSDTTTYNLSLSNIQLAEVKASTVTFTAPTGGSYTVDGTNIAADTEQTNENTKNYSLAATPASGGSFVAWIDGNNKILSTSATVTLAFVENTTVRPIFTKDGDNALFAIGSTVSYTYSEDYKPASIVLVQGTSFGYKTTTPNYLYTDLGEAITAAQSGADKTIVLMNNGTITGDYTIPSGVTLLIPCDAEGTLSTTNPLCKGLVGAPAGVTSITAYRTLTMASGSSITIAEGGAMNVNAVLFAIGGSDRGGGSPLGGYGYIKMADDSDITVQSGGNLYCYGYINGSGAVTAKSGSKVYETFQFEDFRGGSVTSTISQDTDHGVFPLSAYYVQNIMVPLTLEAGARESSYASLHMSNATFGSSVEFISSSNSMFNLKSGSVTKRYDAGRDRLIFDVNGDVEIAGITLEISDIKMKSSEFVLPINSNMTVNLNSGSLSVQQEVALLPGAEVNIKNGANCTLVAGGALYLYDNSDWGPYVSSNPTTFLPAYHVPERQKTMVASELKDAQIIIEGSVTANGDVYTTVGGAAIKGTKGAVVYMTPATSGITYQFDQTNFHEFSLDNDKLTPAQLQNADGSYYKTTDTPKDSEGNYITGYYLYENGQWHYRCLNNVHTPGAEATCGDPQVCTVCGVVVNPATGKHTGDPENPATCTTDQLCIVCGEVAVEALNHKNGTNATGAVTPKCSDTEAGHLAYYACKDCGAYFEDNSCTKPIADLTAWLAEGGAGYVAIPDHTESEEYTVDNVTNKLAATCTTDGRHEEYKTCTGCGVEIANSRITVTDTATGHSYGEWETVQDSTCYREGSKKQVCANKCGIDNTDIIEKKNHTPGDPATCTTAQICTVAECKATIQAALGHDPGETVHEPEQEDGSYYIVVKCAREGCDHVISRTLVVPGADPNHTGLKTVERVEPTCEQPGMEAGWECTELSCPVCQGNAKSGMTVIPATGHSLEDARVTYTWNDDYTECTATGKCSNNCGKDHSVTTEDIASVKTDATCEAAGKITYTATFAEDTHVAEYSKTVDGDAKLVHDWNEASYEWSEDHTSCTATMTCKHNTASSCVREEVVSGITGVVTDPTCETDGHTTYTADFKQTWFTDKTETVTVEGSATGHSWKANGAANWSLDGEVKSCTVNLVCENESSHTMENVAATVTETSCVEATCDKAGMITYTATFAEDLKVDSLITEKTILVLGHNWIMAKPVWTWNDETETYSCTMTRTCDKHSSGTHKETETVEAVAGKDSATCTEAGEITYTAEFENSAFGKQTKTDDTEALGHQMVQTEPKEPTCQEPGTHGYYTCERCHNVYKDEAGNEITTVNAQFLAKREHSYTDYLSDGNATCEEDGTKSRSCIYNCGEGENLIVTDVGSKLGHKYVGVQTKAPNCTEAGEMTYTCENDSSHTYSEDIEPLGHELVKIDGQAADCDAAGWKDYYQCTAVTRNGERTTFCGFYFANENDTAATATPIAENEEQLNIWKTEGGGVIVQRTCVDENHDHDCDYDDCDNTLGEHKDENPKDHKCDYGCSSTENLPAHNDVNTDDDHLCDHCAEPIGDHEYVDGTCNCGAIQQLTVNVTIKAENADDQVLNPTTVQYGADLILTLDFSKFGKCYTIDTTTAMVGGTEVPYTDEDNKLTIDGKYITDNVQITVTAAQSHNSNITAFAGYIAPTCTEDGKTLTNVTCSKCNTMWKTIETPIPANGHTYNEVYTEPTFDADGYTTKTCHCGDVVVIPDEGTKLIAVAKIGDQRYVSLEKAIAAAKADDTIELLMGVAVEGEQTWNLDGITLKIADVDSDYGLKIRGDLTIEGGTFLVAGLYGIGITATGSLTINDGTFGVVEGEENTYLIGSWGNTEINGGTFNGQYCSVNGFAGSLIINDGTFTITLTESEYEFGAVLAGANVANVYGGKFSTSAEEVLASGYCQKLVDNLYVVGKHVAGEAVEENRVNGDCTTDTTYEMATYCKHCGSEMSREKQTITAPGHDYSQEGGKVVTEPTCTEVGYTTYSCANCDETHIGDEVAARGHLMTEYGYVAPTCTTDGNNAYFVCGRCDKTFKDKQGETETTVQDEFLTRTGHAYDEGVILEGDEPTCASDGKKTFTCANDKTHTYTEKVEKLGHDYDWDGGKVVTAPTCTEDGYTTYDCSRCDETHTGDKVDATGHQYEYMGAKSGTCTEAGWKAYYQCQNSCGLYYEDQACTKLIGDAEALEAWKIGAGQTSPYGHIFQNVSGKEPDCVNAGYLESFVCSRLNCKQHFIEDEDGEKILIGDGSQTDYEAWIAEGGNGYLEPKGHTPGEAYTDATTIKAPTCTEDGSHEEVIDCTVCLDEISRETVVDPATGHQNITAKAGRAPSCTTAGYEAYWQCDDCDVMFSDAEGKNVINDRVAIPSTGHTEVIDEAVEATCTATGKTEGKHCSVCGTVTLAQADVPKKNHVLTEIISTKAPSCTEDGSNVVGCANCDYETTEILDATGHTEEEIPEKAPNCTTAGATAGVKCATCGEILTAPETIPATGHNYDWEGGNVVTEPTCTERGYTTHTCSVCGNVSKDTYTDMVPHTEVDDAAVPATCTTTGLTAGKHCSVCEEVTVKQQVIQTVPHTEAIDGKVDPTCTDTGLTEGKHCSVCGEVLVEQEVVEAKGHNGELVAGLAAKCEEDGWMDYYQCKSCKLFFQDEACEQPIENLDAWKTGDGKIPMLGHSWDDGRVTTLPTCTEDGIKTFTCGTCNGTKTEAVPMLGHDTESHDAQHPTYYSAGWEAYETCTRCEYSTYEGIEPLGEPSVSTFNEFMTSLKLLEEYANAYAKANPGKDPMLLLIKYVRTGVDRYNSGSWNIMAGYEDEGFAEYVMKQEETINKEVPTVDDMINVTGIKNIQNFKLPNGDSVDFGHMFGTMDITYHNKTSINHADVAGWAGDLVDLLSTVDRHDITGTVDEMIVEIGQKYLNHSIAGESDQFSQTDMYGDLDGYYFMNELIGQDYENGMLYSMMSEYFVSSLTTEQRADYFLKNRLGGVTSRGDIRDTVFNEYTRNSVIATLEGTREFKAQDVSDMRKACCYAFADYLCKLAGDYVELGYNNYYSVYSSEKSTLAPGITQEIYKGTTADGKNTVFYVATADVNSPYVQVYANYKDNNPAAGWGMQRVLDQANAAQAKYGDPKSDKYIENYNVIASINGAGYNMGTGEPGGLLVMGGKEYHAPNGAGFFGILKDGSAYIGSDAEYYKLKEQGLIMEGISCFGTTLVKDGKINVSPSATYYNDRASRTAVGITKTGKVVFMVMDGRQEPVSCGGSMQEIAQVMLEAGCVQAVNLDGGGSSTYVAKQEGADELSLVSTPSDGFQRSVSTSLIMVSTAPSSTAFDHATLDSEVRHLTIGSTVRVTATGVSATGNPAELPEGVTWAVSNANVASISADGVVTALANGQVDVRLMLGNQIVGSRTLNVVVPDAVYFTKQNMNAVYGEPATLPVAALYEGKPVAIIEKDVTFTLSNAAAGTTAGFTFTGIEASNVKTVKVNAHAVNNPDATSGSININMFKPGETSFDFENADGGDRLLAWNRVVSNSTTVDSVTYTVVDKEKPMVTEYSFAMDMTQIPMPEELTDLVYMLPGADVEGNNSAWSFLLQLAERVSVLTEVKATLKLDSNFDVDYSKMSVNCEYFTLENTSFDPQTNELILSLRWKDQTKAIDPDTANPIVILAGIKLTPKDNAAWDAKDRLTVVNSGNISYDIYLRANALYSFAMKPENQEAYKLFPFINNDVIIGGAPESGGHFTDIYKEFGDEYTLNKGLKNGWVYEDGGYTYYDDGVMYTGVRKVGQYYYDFGENGVNIGQSRYSGMFVENGKNCYAKNGVPTSGWVIVGEDRYCFDENGVGYHGEAVVDEVKLTFNNGLMTGGHTGFIKKSNGKTYHYIDGVSTRGWYNDGEYWYFFFAENGIMITGTHVTAHDRSTYYDFASDGKLLRGYFNGSGYYYWAGEPLALSWVKNGGDPDPEAWYLTNTHGHFATDPTGKYTFEKEIDGVTYTAVVIPHDGVNYTFDNTNGKLLLGNIAQKGGKLYYYWAGEPVNDGWFDFEGKTYYAYADGHLATGVQTIDGKSYMFAHDGALVKDGTTMSITMSANSAQMTIKTSQVEDVTRVRMAVWSDTNGQDDLIWFEATEDGNGVWSLVVPMCQYENTGTYHIHAYEVDEIGALVNLLVGTTYDVTKINQIHSYDDKVDGTCNVCGVNRADVEKRQVVHMFRMYNPYTHEHFYTGSEVERDNLVALGWQYEGVGFTFPANTGAPVHRLYDPATGEHLYTMDEEEKDNLMAKGWNYEGVAFNSAYDTEAVQHRLHNPYETVGAYHFTFSEEEMQTLINAGWEYQGIGWYSCWK